MNDDVGAEMSSPRIAIVIPVTKNQRIGDSEELSLRHLERFLPDYPKYFLAPKGATLVREGFDTKHFSSRYFGSVKAHNTLLLSPLFYRSFSDFEFILIHHLDALVFSNQLDYWCSQGYDLIAPPWIPGPDFPWLKEPGVGNGGFSLRRIDAFLRVLASRRLWRGGETDEDKNVRAANWYAPVRFAKKLALSSHRLNGIRQEIRSHLERGGNEDRFWWNRGRRYYPEFKIASVETALKFAFEAYPRKCLEMNGGQLPFGCHAWEVYDRSFWEPYLLNQHEKSSRNTIR